MIRATCNPNGPGKAWVQARFNVGPAGDPIKFVDPDTGRGRRFIPARIKDNPSLAGSEYEITLNGLSKAKRAALRDGRWDAMEGAYFQYVPVGTFEAQPHWTYYGALDYGWAHRTAFVLLATDGDGHTYVIDTHARNRTPIAAHASAIKLMLGRYGLIPSDLSRMCAGNDLWARKNEFGVMADTYRAEGFEFDRAIDDRINGWQKMIELFGDPYDDENPIWPRVTVHPRNGFLTKSLPLLQHDEKRPEDVCKLDLPMNKPDAPSDDEPDALRYGLMLIANHGSGGAISSGGL